MSQHFRPEAASHAGRVEPGQETEQSSIEHQASHGHSTARSPFGPAASDLIRVGSRRWFLQTGLAGLGGLSMADYLGLTLETVSRQFNALKKEGIISFSDRRRFEVRDIAALHDATGDDADGGLIY